MAPNRCSLPAASASAHYRESPRGAEGRPRKPLVRRCASARQNMPHCVGSSGASVSCRPWPREDPQTAAVNLDHPSACATSSGLPPIPSRTDDARTWRFIRRNVLPPATGRLIVSVDRAAAFACPHIGDQPRRKRPLIPDDASLRPRTNVCVSWGARHPQRCAWQPIPGKRQGPRTRIPAKMRSYTVATRGRWPH